MGEILKWSCIPMDWVTIDGGLVTTSILNKDTMISHGFRQCVLLSDLKDVIIKFIIAIIPLVELDICSLKLKFVGRS